MARSSPNVSYAHFRTDRISLTAAIPLFAINTWVEGQLACLAQEWYGTYVPAEPKLLQLLVPPPALCTHIRNDSVAIVCCDKVLDFAWRCFRQSIAANEMWCQVVFSCIGAGEAIAVAIDLWRCSSHCVGHFRSCSRCSISGSGGCCVGWKGGEMCGKKSFPQVCRGPVMPIAQETPPARDTGERIAFHARI